MADVARHDAHQTRTSNVLHAVDSQFAFTFDDLIDLLLRREVFADREAAFEIV